MSFFKLLFRATSTLPIKVNWFLATIVGNALFFINFKFVKVTRNNIELCFPELSISQANKLTKESIIEDCKTLFELGNVLDSGWESNKKNIIFNNPIPGMDKQTLFIIPHFGSWELSARSVSQKKPAVTLYRKLKSPIDEDFIFKKREGGGLKMTSTERSGIKKLFAAAKSGENLIILPDQYPNGTGGIDSKFFYQSIPTMSLAAKLARKFNLELILVTAIRTRKGFRIDKEDIVIDDDTEQGLTDSINSAIEKAVRNNPEQYLWSHKRFKGLIDYG